MSRPLRIQYPGAWYHVMNRGRRGEAIFEFKEDYHSFLDLLKELDEVFNVKIAAYCLMSTHYHLLIHTPEGNLSRSMRHLNGVYTQRYNKKHSYDGQLFRGRYKAILVDSDSYALELVRYIHRNPLEAGIVENLQNFLWSSHKPYLSHAKKWNWLYKNYILKLFSNSKSTSIRLYKEFVAKEIPEEINQIFSRKNLPSILGKEKFLEKIKQKFFNSNNFEDIPTGRRLAPDVSRIKQEVCKAYDVNEEEFYKIRRGFFNEPRSVAIYLVRYLRNDKLTEVGAQFKISKYGSVSSVLKRVKFEMINNKEFKKKLDNLFKKLSKAQNQI